MMNDWRTLSEWAVELALDAESLDYLRRHAYHYGDGDPVLARESVADLLDLLRLECVNGHEHARLGNVLSRNRYRSSAPGVIHFSAAGKTPTFDS
jgi:hypothetical protein